MQMLLVATLLALISAHVMMDSQEMVSPVKVRNITILALIQPVHTDINECASLRPCDGNATCNDTIGSYTCTCNGGFMGNGLSCQS